MGWLEGEGSPGRRRLALILFGSVFVALFAAVAAFWAEDRPALGAGEVAVVDGLPPALGTITRAELRQAVTQQGAFGSERPPAPGTVEYEELQNAALEELVGARWLRGAGEDMGIYVNNEQIAAELRREPAMRSSLEEAHFTPATIRERVERDLLVRLIEDQLREEAPQPSPRELEIYYEEVKDSAFTSRERRDVRVIANEDLAESEAARRALEEDRSAESWSEVAFQYSFDPVSRAEDGLVAGLKEGSLLSPLREPVFEAQVGDLSGPIEVGSYYFVIEVVARKPAETKPFAEVRSGIRSTLQGRKQQEVYSAWDGDFYEKWHSRTYCAEELAVEKCANHVAYSESNGLSACREEDPEEPPEGCPAVVAQPPTALPGSVTELNPDGEPYVQRPFPEVLEEPIRTSVNASLIEASQGGE